MAIHIIDDDAAITDMLCELLNGFGDHVLCFHSAEAYLSHMNSEAYAEPELMMTDVMMGGMDGFELINIIRARGSKVKIIVMSGFHKPCEPGEKNICCMLAKPFDIELLLSTVAQIKSCSCPCPDSYKGVPAPSCLSL